MTDGGGCTPRTVRYYEREGLLRASRSAGGHRLFRPEELERLNLIVGLREAGWSLDEVTSLFAVRDGALDDRESLQNLASRVTEDIERLDHKIELLQRLRRDLVATQELLAVCQQCTRERSVVACESCTRVPDLDDLPQSFRLTWRARELAAEDPADSLAESQDDRAR